jgi:tRNA G46 methylase TrmB
MERINSFNTVSRFKPKLAELLRDLNLNISSNPQGTDKGDVKSYISGFYEAEFGRRQFENIRILEIGIRTGASLALWANFFENAEIIGIDVEAVGSSAGPVNKYLDYP